MTAQLARAAVTDFRFIKGMKVAGLSYGAVIEVNGYLPPCMAVAPGPSFRPKAEFALDHCRFRLKRHFTQPMLKYFPDLVQLPVKGVIMQIINALPIAFSR